MNNDNEIENENESTSNTSTSATDNQTGNPTNVADTANEDNDADNDDFDFDEDFDDEEEDSEDDDSESDEEVTGSATGTIPALGATGAAESSDTASTEPVGPITVKFTGVRVSEIASVEVPAGSTLSDALASANLEFDGATYKTDTSADLHAKDVLNEDVTILIVQN